MGGACHWIRAEFPARVTLQEPQPPERFSDQSGPQKYNAVNAQVKHDVCQISAQLHERLKAFWADEGMVDVKEERQTRFQSHFKRRAPPRKDADSTCYLIVVDRSIDPLCPLIHDLHYEAACHDLCHSSEDLGPPWAHTGITSSGDLVFGPNAKGRGPSQEPLEVARLDDLDDSVWAACRRANMQVCMLCAQSASAACCNKISSDR